MRFLNLVIQHPGVPTFFTGGIVSKIALTSKVKYLFAHAFFMIPVAVQDHFINSQPPPRVRWLF